uniref:Uncharacterized protein n=1 Tax=Physcomitrium patens TaxID=3218 RepID=A0A2K1JGR0_PHYPA|nr:hypothetical protein PHYPA_018112 [Physcomitrium patens]
MRGCSFATTTTAGLLFNPSLQSNLEYFFRRENGCGCRITGLLLHDAHESFGIRL